MGADMAMEYRMLSTTIKINGKRVRKRKIEIIKRVYDGIERNKTGNKDRKEDGIRKEQNREQGSKGTEQGTRIERDRATNKRMRLSRLLRLAAVEVVAAVAAVETAVHDW
ncbi:8286_t:CDS:2 [Ambispora gerdemannii]|uniref:8286_t:CDS:1 n=1 Tax=Ambispora gerdemannii TaxID=144530 RepID=A0A9N9CPZ0_9GLOM|nr:8286_t:CDS:2 [Ambispora gerdemannii]